MFSTWAFTFGLSGFSKGWMRFRRSVATSPRIWPPLAPVWTAVRRRLTASAKVRVTVGFGDADVDADGERDGDADVVAGIGSDVVGAVVGGTREENRVATG
jgi:hypothetical protein